MSSCATRTMTPGVYPELGWLRDQGVNVRYDEGINPGEEFPERIANAFIGASLVLFYVSPRSAHSRHCRDEIYFALDKGPASHRLVPGSGYGRSGAAEALSQLQRLRRGAPVARRGRDAQ